MIISAFSDDKKDKIAEFYDTHYPCLFLRGVLEQTREEEGETQIMFTVRTENRHEQVFSEED